MQKPCLIAIAWILSLLAGCGDASKQESGSRGTAAAIDPSPAKAADSARAESSPQARTDKDYGFARTWKPPAQTTPPDVTKPLTTPAALRSTVSDDARYADVAALPAPGARSTGFSRNPPGISPERGAASAAADPPLPAIAPPSPATAPSSGNPLRGDNPTASAPRPQDPPAADPGPVAADPIPSVPAAPAAAQTAESKAESAVSTKPAPPAEASPTGTGGQSRAQTPDSARPGPRTNKNSGIPFDPIKENGEIFVDLPGKAPWPKPKLALLITGTQAGYLEPCGCAGLDRMKGGMSRRYSLFKMLREDETFRWPVIGMDAGGTAKGFSKQAEIKFQIAVNGMNAMRYSSVALGLSDLLLPTGEVLSQVMPANGQAKTMFVCGNVGLFAFDEKWLPRTQLISTNFKKIGVTSIVGKTYQQQLAGNTNLVMIDADKLLAEAVPMLKTRSDYLVLLANATHEEAVALGKKYPDFNLIVCSEGAPEPPAQPVEINPGGTKLIEVGEKGMCAIVIGLYDDPQRPFRYQRVRLDSRFKSSPEMVDLMAAYQGQLKDLGLSGLGIRPQLNPLKATNGDYVGSAACQNCHEESYRVWKKTPHSHAFATLKQTVPPRNFDPECVSCHTVGWSPQRFLPYQSGFLSEKETPKLLNVGCEDCHGPGEQHCWAEKHGTVTQQEAARKACRLTEQEAADPNCPKQNCFSCHDLDNSPEFKFNLYFPYVKHYERE